MAKQSKQTSPKSAHASSKYWLDQVVSDITAKRPTGELVVSSGVSPSGPYHIGHFREVLTADAITRALKQSGRKVKHLHFVDDFDPLRKRYPFLPDEFEKYIGMPLYLVPDPDSCHESYGAHYYAAFEAATASLGIEMEVKFAHVEYGAGAFKESIERAVASKTVIHGVMERLANRKLAEEWVPIEILSKNNKLGECEFIALDTSKQTIQYREPDGEVVTADYGEGRVKLNWRLDWPARWALWNVDIEPYGKEHATRGGSYDTGKEFVEQVFDAKAPYPVPYETINLAGDSKKMSSSLGNLVTPEDALAIMPVEILRYFVLKSRPNKRLDFDPGLGLYKLIDEYSQVESAKESGQDHPFARAYEIAAEGASSQTIASVPFSHLVAVYQAALGDFDQIVELLIKSGYQEAARQERSVLEKEVRYVAHWLENYAPESVRFNLQPELPKVELSASQAGFLDALADKLAEQEELEGERIHETIYALKDEFDLKPQAAFQALYLVLLGQKSGPKAGWFLANLDKDWLLKRLRRQE